MSKKNFV